METKPLIEACTLSRKHMPVDYRISLDGYIGRTGMGCGFSAAEIRVPKDHGPGQSMRGFEPTYRNIIDYIVRITHRIWEDRDVEYIGATYADDSRVYDDYGLQLGNRKIIADTHHTIRAFSNIRLIADEVVWAGTDEVGYHTSHRTVIRGTNDGVSKYGPATGKDVDVLVIANCVALDNKIFLEHVLYNNSCQLLQLGIDLNTMASSMAAHPPAGWPRDAATWQELRTAASPALPLSIAEPVSGFDVDAFVRGTFAGLWNNRQQTVLPENYHAEFSFQGPTGRATTGAAAYLEFLAALHSAFPGLQVQVDEVYWMGNDHDGYLSSARWSCTAIHSGNRLSGPPTGCEVQIWGITQHRIMGGRITNEWTLFNELDLMMQICAARP